MRRPYKFVLPFMVAMMSGAAPAGQNGRAVRGSFAIYLILHEVGTETYDIVTNADGTRTLTTTLDYTDRASKRTTTATLTTTRDERPIALEIKAPAVSTMKVSGAAATIDIRGTSRMSATPPGAAVIGAAPFALQMMMMRAWRARGEPRQLSLVSLNPNAEPLEIVRVGRNTITIDKRRVTLDRYTVANLMFGREIVWTTADGAELNLQSDTARTGIRFLKDYKTVVDPTFGWTEMSSHSRETDIASIEPGILSAPAVVDAMFRDMAGNGTAAQMQSFMTQMLSVIGALHSAGVPIVPGSDTGLVGYGLHRELELYVQAGMTPMEAIQSATIVSARAMGLDKDSGTVEAGKRADLILVDGDPLKDIRMLRKVTRVVTNGRMYDTAALWKSVGFKVPRP